MHQKDVQKPQASGVAPLMPPLWLKSNQEMLTQVAHVMPWLSDSEMVSWSPRLTRMSPVGTLEREPPLVGEALWQMETWFRSHQRDWMFKGFAYYHPTRPSLMRHPPLPRLPKDQRQQGTACRVAKFQQLFFIPQHTL